MSTSSLGILRAHDIGSTLSILSHSDTSQSTIDSLEESHEHVILLEKMTSEKNALNDSLEKLKIEDSATDEKKPKRSDDSLDEPNDNKMNGKSDNKAISDALNNNDKANEKTNKPGHQYRDAVVNTKKHHKDTPMIKQKVPKSKTFDATVSIFNHKSAKTRFQNDDSSHSGPSGSGNHVFMTSQECMVVPGCSKLPRETIASRLRFEKQHSTGTNSSLNLGPGVGDGYHKNCVNDGYLTPLQRKEILIKDLKRQVRELNTTCEAKDREIGMYKQHVDEKTSLLVQNKDEEITRLRNELKELKQSYDDISSFCEESIATASVLEQKTEELKTAMNDREKQHQRIYLEMYKKGQDSAKFEREEELERLAGAGGCKVTISELVRKLAWTELELAKWQTIKRHESYHDATRPETEADATLRFLKDSFFHYVTDEKDADHHLRAIIKIFKFTATQMERIKESRLIGELEKRHKKKKNRK